MISPNIANEELAAITGALGYTCTYLLQDWYYDDACITLEGICDGYVATYEKRWGCEAAESGSCSTTKMIRYEKVPCINNPYYPTDCTITGDVTTYYMRACR